MTKVINIAAYKFVELDHLVERRDHLRLFCRQQQIKGTILLAHEGINLFVAAAQPSIQALVAELQNDPLLADMKFKESESDEQPFNRMLVKIKREIIAFGIDSINPIKETAEKISASELRQWLDEGRDITLYDVRNDYEVALGTFADARPAGIDHFRNFPHAVAQLPGELKQKPIVMFCTGGIRCEKAGPYMKQQGFDKVFQLDGGILKYFEECGNEHYQGDCFVFDRRIAVDPQLAETDAELCYVCQAILTPDDRDSTQYQFGISCPHCYDRIKESLPSLESRQWTLDQICRQLPGSVPYENRRPISVPQRCDRMTVMQWLAALNTFYTATQWKEVISMQQLLRNGKPVQADDIVRAGQRLVHLIPDTVEPDVATDIKLLYEDQTLIVVDKPAPLPMHACGRFNLNTLAYLLHQVFTETQLRVVHRLDANTSGVAVFCKSRRTATQLMNQFRDGRIEKRYLARVQGNPDQQTFSCDAPISAKPVKIGKRQIEHGGQRALTRFRLLESFEDGTSLIEATPVTGRTNQIRIHLSHLQLPIVGDIDFEPDSNTSTVQTIDINDPPLCLHAQRICFHHPDSGQRMEIESELPDWTKETENSE
jgi:RluA family pseudouridine synthase